MMRSFYSNKIIQIVAVVLLLALVMPYVALAQTPAPTPSPTPTPDPKTTISPQDLKDANKSVADCVTFSKKLWNVSGNQFKAVWRSTPGYAGGATMTPAAVEDGRNCFIVNRDYGPVYKYGSDDILTIYGIAQPQGSSDLQTTLENGKGITAKDYQTAQFSDQNEQNEASGPSKVVGWILNSIFSVVTIFIAHLTALAGGIFESASSQILDQPMPVAVYIGWSIVRDIANMFFILILIVIALAAILRIESYDYKHLLGEVIMMAILVNFSYVIATTIISLVDSVSMIFRPTGWGEIYAWVWRFTFSDLGSMPNGWMAGLLQGLTKLAFSVVALASFLMLAGLLVVRLVGLYVLVIFSPMAYVLDILPATKDLAHKWWHTFIHYLTWVPVAFFMVKLTILYTQGITASDSAFSYIILMAFMIGGVMMAEHAGMVGGQAIVNGVEKGLHKGFEAGDMWLARGANRKGPGAGNRIRRGLSYLSVGAWQQGYQNRFKTLEHESYTVAAGHRQDLLNKLIAPVPGKGHTTDFGLKAEQQLVADERKQIHTRNNTELIAKMKDSLHSKEGEKAFAYAQALFENYDGNEVLSREGYGTDHAGFQKFIDDNFVPLLGKEKAYRLAYDLSRKAEDANHWNFARAYTANVAADGTITYDKNKDAVAEVMAEIAKMNPQQADRTLNRLGRGAMEVDMEVEAPKLSADGAGFEKDAAGNVIMEKKSKRFNLGFSQFGEKSRRTIDPSAAGATFNTNTAANYMFNDSTGTFRDNKKLWLSLANKFSKMSDQQRAQARSLIGTAGVIAEKDASGNILRYEENDPEVTSGAKKAGEIKYRVQTEAEVKERVFTPRQAYDLYISRQITAADISDDKEYGDLKTKIKEIAQQEGRADIVNELGGNRGGGGGAGAGGGGAPAGPQPAGPVQQPPPAPVI